MNGQPVYKPGVYSLEGAKETFKGSSGAKKGAYSIELYNFRSFGRVTVEGPLISAYIDYIPPPLVWDIVGEVETYSHLNLQINRYAGPCLLRLVGWVHFRNTIAHTCMCVLLSLLA